MCQALFSALYKNGLLDPPHTHIPQLSKVATFLILLLTMSTLRNGEFHASFKATQLVRSRAEIWTQAPESMPLMGMECCHSLIHHGNAHWMLGHCAILTSSRDLVGGGKTHCQGPMTSCQQL